MNKEREKNFEPQLDSGRIMLSGSKLQQQPLRKHNYKSIPHRHFEIKGEAYLTIPYEVKETNSISEALSCLTKDKWEKNSNGRRMYLKKPNHVWDLEVLLSH